MNIQQPLFKILQYYRDGYEGDGYSCYLDPCLTNPCGINAECQRNGRNAQSHQCVCPRGFSGNPNFR